MHKSGLAVVHTYISNSYFHGRDGYTHARSMFLGLPVFVSLHANLLQTYGHWPASQNGLKYVIRGEGVASWN